MLAVKQHEDRTAASLRPTAELRLTRTDRSMRAEASADPRLDLSNCCVSSPQHRWHKHRWHSIGGTAHSTTQVVCAGLWWQGCGGLRRFTLLASLTSPLYAYCYAISKICISGWRGRSLHGPWHFAARTALAHSCTLHPASIKTQPPAPAFPSLLPSHHCCNLISAFARPHHVSSIHDKSIK